MYQYRYALGKSVNPGSPWVEVDVAAMTCSEICRLYRDVMFVLFHVSLPTRVTVHLEDIRDALVNESVSFTNWLLINGSGALPHHDGVPVLTKKSLRCGDAFAANYHFKPTKHTVHPDTELSEYEQTDVLMSREGTDPVDIHDYCLVTVNGLIHRAIPSIHGLYIVDGMKSVRVAKSNQVGILDFQDIGKLETFSIAANQILKPTTRHQMKDNVYIKFPTPFEGKTPMVVLGGYLHVMNDTLVKVSEDTVMVKINRLPWVERYYQSNALIDLSSLPIDTIDDDPTDSRRSYAELTSDDTVRAMLQLSQSFLVLLDAPNLQISYRTLEHTGLPGRYLADHHIVGMVQGAHGILPEYLVFPEHGKYVVAMEHYREPRKVIDTYRYEKTGVIVDYEATGLPRWFVNARVIDIDSVEITYRVD
jgi:hypothetical protein